MNLLTLLGFLVGRRDCIEAFARSPHTLWIGAVFMLSGGFARSYDRHALLQEPWQVVVPLILSLPIAGVLYLGMTLWCTRLGQQTLLDGFRTFLGLFWLTGLLFWPLAISHERLRSPNGASESNLITLQLILTWQAALVFRIGQIAGGMEVRPLVRRMVYSYSVFLVVVLLAYWPYGIHLPIAIAPRGRTYEFADHGTVSALGFLWLYLFMAILYAVETLDRWDYHPVDWLTPAADGPRMQPSLAVVGVVSLLIWPLVLPFTQPQQQRRFAVESAIARGDYEQAATLLRQWPREAFPPHWKPAPPALWPHTLRQDLPVLARMADEQLPDWAATWYRDRLDRVLSYYVLESDLADEPTARALAAMPAVRRWMTRQERNDRSKTNLAYLKMHEANAHGK